MIEWILFGVICLATVAIFWRERLALRMHASDHKLHESDQKVITAHEKLREALETDLEEARRQLKVHREQNEEFEKQRNYAWKLYRNAGLQAGNAQGMLMREIERLSLLLNASRKEQGKDPVAISTPLQAVVDEFRQEHGSGRSDQMVVPQ